MKIPGGPTNWSLYDVPTIAAMLDEHYDEAWDQVMAWRYAYDTISEHRAQLSHARAELAAGWPPEQSIASERYFETIDGLDRSLADTSDAAIRNSNALADVLTALSQAKASIDWLHASWKTNVLTPTMSAQESGPIGTTMNAALIVDLNAQAHEIMAKTDQVIFENTRQLSTIVAYSLPSVNEPYTQIPDPSESPTNSSNKPPAKSPDPIPSTSKPPQSFDGKKQNEPISTLPITSSGATKTGATVGMIGGLVGVGASSVPFIRAVAPNSTDNTNLPDTESKPADAGDRTRQTANTRMKQESSESPNASEMLAPGIGTNLDQQGRQSRRRRRQHESWTMPKGVPALLRPQEDRPVIHDPGPGVIGIDR